MLAGHQVLPGTDNYYSHAFRNSALMILQKMLPLLFFDELNWISVIQNDHAVASLDVMFKVL